MKYDTFISYSINDSSVAYELSGLLSKKNITYYLDCVESGVITNEYTKRKVAECDVYIIIPNKDKHNEYATAMMEYALSMGKPVAILATKGKELPEAVAAQPTYGSLKELAEGVKRIVEIAADAIQNDNADTTPATIDDTPNVEADTTPSSIDEDIATDADAVDADVNIPSASATPDDDADTRTLVEIPDTVLTGNTEGYREHKGSNEEFYEEAKKYAKSGHKYEKVDAPTVTATTPSEETEKNKDLGEILGQIFAILIVIAMIIFGLKSCFEDTGNIIDTSIECIESDIQRALELKEMGKKLYSAGRKNEAAGYLQEAAEMGNVHAMYYLGLCYKKVESKEHVCCNWLYRAAKAGVTAGFHELKEMAVKDISIAQVHLGTCYFYGYGTKKDRKTAVYWYNRAAALENPQGYFFLAKCYEHGEGTITNKRKALKMYQQAEKLGHKQGKREAKRLYDELDNDD